MTWGGMTGQWNFIFQKDTKTNIYTYTVKEMVLFHLLTLQKLSETPVKYLMEFNLPKFQTLFIKLKLSKASEK